jgi:hypothetical protein
MTQHKEIPKSPQTRKQSCFLRLNLYMNIRGPTKFDHEAIYFSASNSKTSQIQEYQRLPYIVYRDEKSKAGWRLKGPIPDLALQGGA